MMEKVKFQPCVEMECPICLEDVKQCSKCNVALEDEGFCDSNNWEHFCLDCQQELKLL